MLTHPLANLHVINLDEYELVGTHSIAFHVNGDNGKASIDVTYFDSFGIEHIPKEIQKFPGKYF